MLTTPNYNLEYAEGADPAKQYPSAVDAPSKTKIDAALKAHADLFASLGLSGKAVKYGTTAPTVSGSGGATVPFGYTFAGVPVVLAVIGDENAAYSWIQIVNSSITTSQFAARVYTKTGVPATSGAIRINWIAIGTAASSLLRPAPGDARPGAGTLPEGDR